MKGVLSTSLKLVEKRTQKSISCLVGGVVGIDSVRFCIRNFFKIN